LSATVVTGCFTTLVEVDDLGSGEAGADAQAEAGGDAPADSAPDQGADAEPSDAADAGADVGSDASEDAAVDGADDAVDADGNTDAAPDQDAPDVTDAPVDTVADSDASGGWCDTNGVGAVFCDDFEGALVWDGENVSPASSLTVTTAGALSPPRSLELHVNAFSQGGDGEAYRTQHAGPTSGALTFSYAMYLDTVASSQGAVIPSQLVLVDGGGVELRLSILITTPYAVKLETETRIPGQSTKYDEYSLVGQPPLGGWVTLAYQVSESNPRELSITLDGQPALQGLALDVLQTAQVTPSVHLGACYAEAPSDPWTIRYDNVLLR